MNKFYNPNLKGNCMRKFKVVCNTCGNENVSIVHYQNEYEEGFRFKCEKCGAKEEL